MDRSNQENSPRQTTDSFDSVYSFPTRRSIVQCVLGIDICTVFHPVDSATKVLRQSHGIRQEELSAGPTNVYDLFPE